MAKRLERKTAENYRGLSAAPANASADRLFGLTGALPRVVEIDLGWIDTRSDQPRKTFEDDALQSLAQSIREYGLKQPILVRQEESGRYTLITGERRLRAHHINGAGTIVAIVAVDSDPDATALLENTQRADLNAVELACAVKRLTDRPGYTQEKVAALVGLKSHTQVSRLLRILTLPQAVLDDVPAHHAQVSRATLIEIAGIDDPKVQLSLWERAKAGLASTEVRAEKRRTARPDPDPNGHAFRAIGQALLKMSREVGTLTEHQGVLSREHLDSLRSLREQIDGLLGER